MSEVEDKVVRMQFDGSRFNSACEKTMGVLDKLREKLRFKDAEEGFENITDSAEKVDMSNLSKGATAVQESFSAMEIFCARIIEKLADRVFEFGEKFVKGVFIEPLTTGFSEYEEKVGSVQTILASTEKDGETIQTVTGYLEQLNEYSDRTIYSFKDMTSNIGKFVNNGIKLEDAVQAMKGISNEAALSGANATEASRAMYNLSQAMSLGYMQLIDWKSIQNANMATTEFKTHLAEAAVEMGKLQKSDLSNINVLFTERLKDKWLTNEVMIKVLKDYADETTEIGKKSFRAAQEVKTLSMLWDTMKEAAQSGWGVTYELIVGNYKQATQFFTAINDAIDPLLSKMADFRNGVIEKIMGDGTVRGRFTRMFTAFIKLVDAFRDTVHEAFAEVFGELDTDKIRKFFQEGFLKTAIRLENMKYQGLKTVKKFLVFVLKVVKPILRFGKKVIGIISDIVSFIISIPKRIREFIDSIKQSMSEFKDYFLNLKVYDHIGKTRQLFTSVGRALKDVSITFNEFKKTVSSIFEGRFPKKQEEFVDKTVEGTEEVVEKVSLIKKIATPVFQFFADVIVKTCNRINIILNATARLIEKIFGEGGIVDIISDSVKTISENIRNELGKITFKSLTDGIRKGFDEIWSKLRGDSKEDGGFVAEGFFEGIRDGALNLGKRIVGFFAEAWQVVRDFFGIASPATMTILDGGYIVEGLEIGIEEEIPTLLQKLSNFFKPVEDFFDELADKLIEKAPIGSALAWVIDFITSNLEKLEPYWEKVKPELEKLYEELGGISGIIKLIIANKFASGFKALGEGIKGLGESFGDFVESLGSGIFKDNDESKWDKIGNTIFKMVVAIGIIAAATYLLSRVQVEDIENRIGIIAGVLGSIFGTAGLIGFITTLVKSVDSDKTAKKIEDLGNTMIKAAIFMAVMGWSLVRVMNSVAKVMITVTEAMNNMYVGSPERLSAKVDAIKTILITIGTMVVGMAVVFGLLKKAKMSSALFGINVLLSMVGIAGALALVAWAINKIPEDGLKKFEGQIEPLVTIVVGIVAVMTLLSKSSSGLALTVAALAVSIYYIAKLIDTIPSLFNADGSIKDGVITLAAIAGMLVVLGVVFGILSSVFENVSDRNNVGSMLVGVIGAIAIFILVCEYFKQFAQMESINVSNVLYMAGAIVAIFAAMALVFWTMSMIDASDNSMGQLAVVFAGFAAAMWVITNSLKSIAGIPESSLEKAFPYLIGLAAIIAGFAILLSLATLISSDVGTLAVLTVAVAAIFGVMALVLGLLSNLGDVAKINAVANAMTTFSKAMLIIFLGLAALVGVMAVANYFGGGAAVAEAIGLMLSMAVMVIGIAGAFALAMYGISIAVNAITDSLVRIANLGKEGVDVLLYFFQGLIDLLPELMTKLGQGIPLFIENYIRTWIEVLVRNFGPTFEKIRDWVVGIFGTAWEAVKEFFGKVPGWFSEVGSKIVEAVKSLIDKIMKPISGAIEKVGEWLEPVTSFFGGVGETIKEKSKGAWESAKGFAQGIEDTMRNVLGCHSDSDVTEDIAEEVAGGYEHTIEDRQETTNKVMEEYGYGGIMAMVKGQENGFDNMAKMWNGIDLNSMCDYKQIDVGVNFVPTNLDSVTDLTSTANFNASGLTDLTESFNNLGSGGLGDLLGNLDINKGGGLGGLFGGLKDSLGGKLDVIASKLGGDTQIVLDSGQVVGATVDKTNAALGKTAASNTRVSTKTSGTVNRITKPVAFT